MKILQVMHFDNHEYSMFKEAGRLSDFHNCQYMGYDYFLKKGYDVKWYVPKCKGWFQKYLCKVIKKPSVIGLLNVPKVAKDYDVVYCPLDNHYFLLGIFKFLGLLKTPVLCISHLSFNTDDTDSRKLRIVIRLGRFVLFRTFDYIAFISNSLLKRAKEGFNVPNEYANAINWGADNSFYNTDKSDANYYVAIGQAKRDFKTIVKAFETLPNSKLKILARGEAVLKQLDIDSLPENIEIIDNPYDVDHWLRMKEIYAGAKASLIPLVGSHHIPCGATVITESIASATPILITSTSNNMVNVEAEGIGEELPCGDVKGWVETIKRLECHSELLRQYSDNARNLSTQTYNYTSFCKRVEDAILLLAKFKN